jgi:hypothetical protein
MFSPFFLTLQETWFFVSEIGASQHMQIPFVISAQGAGKAIQKGGDRHIISENHSEFVTQSF